MIERSAERDAAIDALLPLVPGKGWTVAALREAAGGDADLLFPGGAVEMVEVWADLADRRTMEAAATLGLENERLPARIRALIALRFEQNRAHKAAIRRGLAVLARPSGKIAAARITARTVDVLWHAAGDRSADFSWYTKRATLAGVYGATLLRWLADASEDDAESLAFLDRRLGHVARIGKARRRVEAFLHRLRAKRSAG